LTAQLLASILFFAVFIEAFVMLTGWLVWIIVRFVRENKQGPPGGRLRKGNRILH